MQSFKWSPGTVNAFPASSPAQNATSNVEKAMFEMLAVHFQLIFFLLTNPECDFCEVEKAMFQVVAGHCELIFCQLTTSKCNWGEVENAMFQGLARHLELIFGLLVSTEM